MYVCMCLTSRHCLYLAVARSEGGKKTGRLKLRRLDFRSSVHTNFGKFAVASEFGEHRGNVVDSQCSPHGMSPPPLSLLGSRARACTYIVYCPCKGLAVWRKPEQAML